MAKLAQIFFLIMAAMAAIGNVVEAYDVLLGAYYGLNGANLPPPARVVQLCKQHNIYRIRLPHPDLDVLESFRGMGIDVSFSLPNDLLPNMAANNSAVEEWFNTYVQPFIGDYVINYIIVGDKVIPGLDDCILPVMKALQNLLNVNYLGQVKLTTLVGYNSGLAVKDPPSSGEFYPTASENMKGILKFLATEGSPLMVSVYPYRKYLYSGNISLDHATFCKTNPAVSDGELNYYNLFDEMVDAFYAAIEKENAGDVTVAVGETGWPTRGSDAATVKMASRYNRRFKNHICSGKGTPRRPNVYMEGFIQSLFNEDEAPQGESQYYGTFNDDLSPIYPLFT